MSWKGFQKGIVRTPQNLLQKMNHAPKDPMFIEVQQRFDDIEMQIKRLHTECKRYWDAIGRLLYHQTEFSKVIQHLYQPITGRYILAQGEVAEDPSSDPEGAAAAENYVNLVAELQQLIQPELEMIETRILKPADDLLIIINSIKKMLTKREHKRLDLDRHTQSLRKMQDRDERSVKQEEKMYKVENEYEMALEEYNYYNDLLKDELPKLFMLEGQFIKPLFQSLYFMQLNIYYSMHVHMEEMKIPRFNMDGDMLESFYARTGDVAQRVENIGIANFRRTQPQNKLETLRNKHGKTGDSDSDSFASAPMSPRSPSSSQFSRKSSLSRTGSRSESKYESVYESRYEDSQENRYGDRYEDSHRQRPGSGDFARDDEPAPPKPARPARRPVPQPNPTEFCTALYDFEAQNVGDLSFREGDRIEIVKRTEKAEGWWTGNLNGTVGTFPGNYVELN